MHSHGLHRLVHLFLLDLALVGPRPRQLLVRPQRSDCCFGQAHPDCLGSTCCQPSGVSSCLPGRPQPCGVSSCLPGSPQPSGVSSCLPGSSQPCLHFLQGWAPSSVAACWPGCHSGTCLAPALGSSRWDVSTSRARRFDAHTEPVWQGAALYAVLAACRDLEGALQASTPCSDHAHVLLNDRMQGGSPSFGSGQDCQLATDRHYLCCLCLSSPHVTVSTHNAPCCQLHT